MIFSDRARSCLALLVCCDLAVVLVFLFFLSPLWPWGPSHVHALDPNGEANVPTWYSSSKLLLAALSFVLAGRQARSVLLCAVGALALGMSADETANLHELAGLLLSQRLPPEWQLFELPSAHMWPYVYGMPVVVMAALVLGWLMRRDRSVGRDVHVRIVSSFGVFFVGALGMELLQQHWAGPLPAVFGVSTLMLLEESLENLGASLLLWTGLWVLRQQRAAPMTANVGKYVSY